MSNRARTTDGRDGRNTGTERRPADDAPEAKPGAEPSRGNPDSTHGEAGQLTLDDRGNISWEWASDDPELLADDVVGNTARLRALAPRDLELADEDISAVNRDLAAQKGQPIPVRKAQRTGYNPYDSGEPTKQTWKKKRDLRELSKWIKLKKRMRNKRDEG
jgi:hypothetical protein